MFLLSMTVSISAVDKKKEEVKEVPLYQGIQIGLDLFSPMQALYSNTWGAGIKADINLKNKYFPTIEVGFTNLDKISDAGIHCNFSGQYFKAGVNIPLSIFGEKAENMFFAGAHYGFSAFTYNLENLNYSGNYWGSSVSSFQNEKAVAGWIEIVAGVRVLVLGPISMGWTLQYKSTLHVSNGENSIPPYIPGYGLNIKPMAGMAFHLYYRLPF